MPDPRPATRPRPERDPPWRQPGARLRYAQCWEDADCLLAALEPRAGQCCLSIGSGGENSLALLTRDPARVIVVDVSPAQMAALELKVAAFRTLSHGEMLVLLGAWDDAEGPPPDRRPRDGRAAAVPGPLRQRRLALYQRCRPLLSPPARRFWDQQGALLAAGALHLGRFERYLALFRRWILPLAHRPAHWQALLQTRTLSQRQEWYEQHGQGRLWRWLMRAFCSRRLLGRLGTDPSCLVYGDGSLADLVLERLQQVLVAQDPAANPYLHWILLGRFDRVLPCALRRENHDLIRTRLDRLQLQTTDLQTWLASGAGRIDAFNLSNIFDYLSLQTTQELLQRLHQRATPGARLVCWNRLAERGPQQAPLAGWWPLAPAAGRLQAADRLFFYRRLVVAEARRPGAGAVGHG